MRARAGGAGSWRDIDLAAHPVVVSIDGEEAATGKGANALGDPRIALTWLANDRVRHGVPLAAGDVIITGTCIVPAPIAHKKHVHADFGALGSVEVALASF